MYKEVFIMAWTSLVANKMRSLLTMLGVIIGVAAVITLVSIGIGTRQSIQASISSLGSNLIMIYPGTPRTPGIRPVANSLKTLNLGDYEAIKNLAVVAQASPVSGASEIIVYKNKNWTSNVNGVNPDFQYINNWEMDGGRFITEPQVKRRERVAVLGATVAENLFGEENPVGQNIRIDNIPFKVIGILHPKGSGGFGGDQDDVVLIPYTTAMERLLAVDYLRMIFVQGQEGVSMNRVQADIENILRVRHQIKNPELDDFNVKNMQAIMQTVNETTGILTLFLGSVAAISLFVGGIGIMNIMLVSVTERTKEIGIRKALGATYQMIITQFIIEAMVISILGGLMGIGIGIVFALLIDWLTPMHTVITFLPIGLAFTFSMLVGLIFGIYPARKAAKLDPIEALHYE